MTWKRSFTATQRGLRLICAVAVAIAIGTVAWRSCKPEEVKMLSEAEREELERFRQEQARMDSTTRKQWTSRKRRPAAVLFPFDPNTADSASLVRLGLAPWQARNVLKYRRKGGRWRSPDDFARLYGLSHEDFLRLKPYIRIAPVESGRQQTVSGRSDSVRWVRQEKYPAGTVIDINAADTNELKHIPGIGSYYARRICEYRSQLGAFVSPDQLKAINGLPADIEQWFRVEGHPAVKTMNVNKATFQELVRHPYLDYEQVKALFDYRRKHGEPKSWKELRLLPPFRHADTTLLHIYLAF